LTSLYAIHQLVYFERFDSAAPSLSRQAELERLPRILKLRLVETRNPDWRDLYDDLATAGTILS
jgi:putative endonuclease